MSDAAYRRLLWDIGVNECRRYMVLLLVGLQSILTTWPGSSFVKAIRILIADSTSKAIVILHVFHAFQSCRLMEVLVNYKPDITSTLAFKYQRATTFPSRMEFLLFPGYQYEATQPSTL
jgi:hypothetical protein